MPAHECGFFVREEVFFRRKIGGSVINAMGEFGCCDVVDRFKLMMVIYDTKA